MAVAVAQQLFITKSGILDHTLCIHHQDHVRCCRNQTRDRIGIQTVEKTLRLVKTPRLLSRCSFERLGHKNSIN